MKRAMRVALLAACASTAAVTSAVAEDFATKDEAQAMVKKATAFIKEQGAAGAYTWFESVVKPKLGGNAKLVGKDMIDAQDVDGKPFVKERVELASKQANFWQDYKFVNPVSKKVEPKQMYCERFDQTAVCAGIYKR